MKWADFCVFKLSLTEYGMIDNIVFYKDLGESLGAEEYERDRAFMVQEVNNGKTFCSIRRNKTGSFNKIGDFSYVNNLFSWYIIPQNLPRRKTFISYYHKGDQQYKQFFNNLSEDLIISKSVEKGDIDSDNSDGYIKQLIQKKYLSDTTVLVVLIGPKTKCRMHVDWEISGALNLKVGDKYAGLVGFILPNHPDYGKENVTYASLPQRLSDNFKSGYAIIRDWTEDRIKIQSYIEDAYTKRTSKANDIDNSRIQMDKDTCE